MACNEQEIPGEEVFAVGKFNVLSQNSPVGSVENRENLRQYSRFQAGIPKFYHHKMFRHVSHSVRTF